MNVFERLIKTSSKNGADYLVLIDPDKLEISKIPHFMESANRSDVDGILIGGSILISGEFENFVIEVKKHAGNIPVILFPGGVNQISASADALLFLSMISGREAQHLIGTQVLAAPIIHRIGIETIATAYILIESGKPTSAQFMSGTNPLPRHKPEIAVAHALAAQYLGFKLIYLEAGSGADHSVPNEMVKAVTKTVDIPVIVGGGICTPDDAREKVEAGASFVVTGTIIENSTDSGLLKKFANAIHLN
ncbi:geranylgeranylglyceryl/heptaprenylglyceryl phosphate synthase [Calditrichota bacterium]